MANEGIANWMQSILSIRTYGNLSHDEKNLGSTERELERERSSFQRNMSPRANCRISRWTDVEVIAQSLSWKGGVTGQTC